jgi:hypothetical protein
MGLGSRIKIRDPEKTYSGSRIRIPDPDPGVKKAPDPGSGSATLEKSKVIFRFHLKDTVQILKKL